MGWVQKKKKKIATKYLFDKIYGYEEKYLDRGTPR